MEIVELPLKNHYLLITYKSFSTFVITSNSADQKIVLQDVPLRFCMNVMLSDPSDLQMKDKEAHFYERFKFLAIKYFGMPVLAEKRLKDIVKEFEKPISEHMDQFDERDQNAILLNVSELHPSYAKKTITFQRSPLFVFTRNGVPDIE